MAFLDSRGTDGAQIRWNLAVTRNFRASRRRPPRPQQPFFALVLGDYCGDRSASGIKQRSESCRRIGPHRLRDVAVELEGGLNGIVPQALAHGLYVDAGFEDGSVAHTGEDVPAAEYQKLVDERDGLKPLLAGLGVGESPAAAASGIEFVLEGLHLTKRLNKDALGGRATYRARG